MANTTDCPNTLHPISPLRQRMIEDMAARKLGPASQRGHILACNRFAAFFLLHINVLSALFRAKMLAMLTEAHAQGRLQFLTHLASLADQRTFKRFLGPLRPTRWVVYCKAPFAGPKAVLRYLARYTHRVAISNRRLIAADDGGVSFR